MKIYKCLIVLLIILIFASGGLIYKKYQVDAGGEAEYSGLRSEAVSFPAETAAFGDSTLIPESLLPTVDEKKLLGINRCYAAWLYLPDSPVSYPVVFPKNNREYLKNTFEGIKRPCGSLFIDSCSGLASLNTVIHGHNMKSGAMFGCLKNYFSKDFMKKHRRLYLLREGEWNEYQLLSVYLINNAAAFPYIAAFLSDSELKKYTDASRSKSIYDTGVNTGEVRNLLTLSTCHGKNEKLIIQWAAIQ